MTISVKSVIIGLKIDHFVSIKTFGKNTPVPKGFKPDAKVSCKLLANFNTVFEKNWFLSTFGQKSQFSAIIISFWAPQNIAPTLEMVQKRRLDNSREKSQVLENFNTKFSRYNKNVGFPKMSRNPEKKMSKGLPKKNSVLKNFKMGSKLATSYRSKIF